MSAVCKVAGCDTRSYVRGWCRHHYESWLIYGDEFRMRRGGPGLGPVVCDCPTSTPERIALFDAWQCSVCYRKCDPPVAVSAS